MADLNIKITLDGAQFRGEVGEIASDVKTFESTVDVSFDNMLAKVTAYSFAFNQISDVVSQVSAFVEEPVQKFIDLDSAMSNTATLGVNNIDELRHGVLDASIDIAVPIGDISSGLSGVVSAGVDASSQLQVLGDSARAGLSGVASTNDSLRLGAALVKGYGTAWSEFTPFLDQAFKTVELGQTTFGELAGSIGPVVALASGLSVASKELFGTMATLTGVTGNTSEVATQLKAIFSELSKPTSQLTALFKKHGFESVELAVKQRGLIGVIDILKEATGGSTTEMNKYFGSVEAVTALMSLSTSQYDNFVKKTFEIGNAHGAMSNAFDIQSESIAAKIQLLTNKWDVFQIGIVDSISPMIGSVLDFSSALLDVDFDNIIIGATTAGGALVGLGVAKVVTDLGGLSPALRVAGASFITFGNTARLAITSIPFVGWAAAGVTALGSLGAALLLTADSEKELADKRIASAKETIKLIEAEKSRVKQAIETKGETGNLAKEVENLNKNLARQHKIIADANIAKYKIELEEANEAVAGLRSTFFDLFTEDKVKAAIFRETVKEVGEDVFDIENAINKALEEIGEKLRKNRAGSIELADQEIERLEREQRYYFDIANVVTAAADAQRKLNDEIARRDELSSIETTIDITTNANDADPTSGIAGSEIQIPIRPVLPNIDQILEQEEFEATIPAQLDVEMPEDVSFFDEDALAEKIQFQEELIQLHFDNNLITEEQYNLARIALFKDAAAVYEQELGKESIAALKANAKKLQLEKNFQQKRRQMAAETTSSFLGGIKSIFDVHASTNETAFKFSKALSYSQAVVDTYAAANRALATYPPPFGGIAASAAVLAGLANVAKISKQKFESRADGGFLGDEIRTVAKGSFGGGEDRFIIANSREFIVNEFSTSLNRDVLEVINNERNKRFRLVGQNVILGETNTFFDGGFVASPQAGTAEAPFGVPVLPGRSVNLNGIGAGSLNPPSTGADTALFKLVSVIEEITNIRTEAANNAAQNAVSPEMVELAIKKGIEEAFENIEIHVKDTKLDGGDIFFSYETVKREIDDARVG